jgi:Fe2+ transport system protein FeoA
VFLTEEVAERTRNAPTALIDLIDLSVKERRALSPDVPDLTASYELENRETELGRDLRRVEVAALALVGRFDEAFEQFQALDDRDGPGARKSASGALFALLTENADDLTFLKYGLAFANDATQSEAAELANILSRRLLDLGFHQASSVLLSKAPLDEQNSDRRMMHAEIALRREQPQIALVELMGLKGKQADRLRAQALWLNEEYERAAEYLLESEDQNGAARGFWYSADLEAAEQLDRDAAPFGEVAELTIGIDEAAQAPEGLTPLAEARSLVDSSMSARTDIERLLGQVTRSEEE